VTTAIWRFGVRVLLDVELGDAVRLRVGGLEGQPVARPAQAGAQSASLRREGPGYEHVFDVDVVVEVLEVAHVRRRDGDAGVQLHTYIRYPGQQLIFAAHFRTRCRVAPCHVEEP
jgi:hypothetical protein